MWRRFRRRLRRAESGGNACAQVAAFQAALKAGGAVATLRDSRGDDEMAACGQLGNTDDLNRLAPLLRVPEQFREALAAAA